MKRFTWLILWTLLFCSPANAVTESGSGDAQSVVLYGKTSSGALVPINVNSSGAVSTGLGGEDSIGGTYARILFDPLSINGNIRLFTAGGAFNNAIDFELDDTLNEINIDALGTMRAITFDGAFEPNEIHAGGTKGISTLDLTSQVISYYKFEEESGTTTADSVGANTGTSTDDTLVPKDIGTYLSAPGQTGHSILTDGVSGINLGDVAAFKFAGDFTVCLQARAAQSDADSGETLMGNRLASGANTGFVITLGAGGSLYRTAKLTVDVGASAVTLEGTTHIDDAQYHVICVKRTTDVFALFVDGNNEGTPSGTSAGSLALAGNTYIGGSPNVGFTGEFEGNIDNVLLAGVALSDENIQSLTAWWAAGKDGLVLYTANGPNVFSTTTNETSVHGAADGDDLIVGDKLEVQGQMWVASPAAQTISAGNTIAADACGSIKFITSAGAVSTDTTNTFTAPAALNKDCCMTVINSGSNSITLDNNALFTSAGAADVVLGAGDSANVCSSGLSGKWYQVGASNN